MRRPNKHEAVAGLFGAGLGAAAGVAIEGLPPEVVHGNLNTPAQHSSETDEDVANREEAGALFQRSGNSRTKSNKSEVSGGVGPEPKSDSSVSEDEGAEQKVYGGGWDGERGVARSLSNDILNSVNEKLSNEWGVQHDGENIHVVCPAGSRLYRFDIFPNSEDGTYLLKWASPATGYYQVSGFRNADELVKVLPDLLDWHEYENRELFEEGKPLDPEYFMGKVLKTVRKVDSNLSVDLVK